MKINFLICLVILVFSCKSEENNDIQASLKNTKWNSQFYHYCNFYSFDTDSTGVCEYGQTAWSVAVDLDSLGIPENKILYYDPTGFKYGFTDSVLTIKIDGSIEKYNYSNGGWVSQHEYVYGREKLIEGKKNIFYDSIAD